MKRKNWLISGMLLALASLSLVAGQAHAVTLSQLQWQAAGPGTRTAIVDSTPDNIRLQYRQTGSSVWSGLTWNAEGTAARTETVTLDWQYSAFHAWFRAHATVYAYADGPNGRQWVQLLNNPISGGISGVGGTVTLNLTQGQRFGFQVYGSNFDSTSVLEGTLDVQGSGLADLGWVAGGPGTRSVTPTAGEDCLRLNYRQTGSSVWSGLTWNAEATAQRTETATLDWRYSAFHAWYQAHATVYAYADGPNGRQWVQLFNGGISGGVSGLEGTVTLNLTQGQRFGFQVYGRNFDSTSILEGELEVCAAPDTNTAPTAANLNVNTAEETAVEIALEGSDADGDALTYTVVEPPTFGTLTGTGSDLTYVPNANFYGADSFTYSVSDGEAESNVASVQITVSAVNDAPVAANGAATTDEDTAVQVGLSGSDVEGSALTYTVVSGPSHGTLSGSGANRTYTPDANYNGVDSFTFKVSDGQDSSNTAIVSLTINAVNDAPVADATATSTKYVISSNNTDATVSLDGTRSSDVDGDALTYAWYLGGNPLATGATASATVPVGTQAIELRVSDGSATGTTTVTIPVLTAAQATRAIQPLVGGEKSLLAQLESAAAAFERGQMKAGCNQLRAFINHVNAQSGKKINATTAAELVARAQEIIRAVGQ